MLRKVAIGGAALVASNAILAGCGAPPATSTVSVPAPADLGEEAADDVAEHSSGGGIEAAPEGAPVGSHVGRLPSGDAAVTIDKLGEYTFDTGNVSTLRPDVFQPGHFSLFDVLAHLGENRQIDLSFHFDEGADTHVVDSLNGEPGWWHEAFYSAGWPEPSVFRLDHYPYKPGTNLRFRRRDPDFLDAVHDTFREEVARLAANGGDVVVPSLRIESPERSWSFDDVLVTPHDLRGDVLQPGTVTALDALLSLEEQGQLRSVGLKWYDQIGAADPVDSYWVEQVEVAEAYGGCGFVYETGPRRFPGFNGSHIHIPADVRVTVSPEYALWFWICLGRGS